MVEWYDVICKVCTVVLIKKDNKGKCSRETVLRQHTLESIENCVVVDAAAVL